MTAKISRLNDSCSGICTHASHGGPTAFTGVISSVSVTTTKVESVLVSTIGDTVTATCGHSGTINTSPGKAIVEGKVVTVIGATFVGDFSGTVTGGNSTVDS